MRAGENSLGQFRPALRRFISVQTKNISGQFMDTVIRTLIVKVKEPTSRKSRALLTTMARFRKSANYHLELCKEVGVNGNALHRRGYEESKRAHRLGGNLVQAAKDKAVAAFRSHLKVGGSWPRFTGDVLRLNIRQGSCRVFRGHAGWTVRVSTVDGPVRLPLVATGPRWRLVEIAMMEGRIKGGELVHRDGLWTLHLFERVECPVPYEPETVLGVDLGVKRMAVASDPEGHRVKFFHGGPALDRREHHFKLRRELQRKGLRRKVKALKGRETRHQVNLEHVVANEVVQAALEARAAIALEDLRNLKWRGRRAWSRARLGKFIEFKAALSGVPVLRVGPAYTTRHCGLHGRGCPTRRSGPRLSAACGYVVDADFNGARGIARRGLDRYTRSRPGRSEPAQNLEKPGGHASRPPTVASSGSPMTLSIG